MTPAELSASVAERFGVTATALFIPQPHSRNAQEKELSLNWLVTFERPNRHRFTVDYMQGIAHVPGRPQQLKYNWQREYERRAANEGKYPRDWANDRAFQAWRTIPAPLLADVLYCLLSEGEAFGMDFTEWCGNFGYDTDSRKAEAVYNACKATGHNLARMFTPAELETLRDDFQDY